MSLCVHIISKIIMAPIAGEDLQYLLLLQRQLVLLPVLSIVVVVPVVLDVGH